MSSLILNTQEVELELSPKLQELIESANNFIKLAKDKILEAYNYAVDVDGYNPKDAKKLLENNLKYSKRYIRECLPEESKNMNMLRSPSSSNVRGTSSSNNDNDDTVVNITTSHKVQDVETESYPNEVSLGEKIEGGVVEEEEKQKLVENSQALVKAQNIINDLYPPSTTTAEEVKVFEETENIKYLQDELKSKIDLIKTLNEEIVNANKKIEELSIELVGKERKPVRFSKDIEIAEDKVIPINGTCYCGGSAEDHIILLDLKRFKELNSNK